MIHANLAISIRVNNGQSVEEAVKAGGYDWKSGYFTNEHFPSTCSGTENVSLHLVHFGREMTTEEALEELDGQNLQPATIGDLLALGANSDTRDLQRQFPIVALGSYWDGPYNCRNVPALLGDNNGRDASMFWIKRPWEEDMRFLAVKKD